jgi:hypothetical protein
MLSVIVVYVIMLSVIVLYVIMLSVVVALKVYYLHKKAGLDLEVKYQQREGQNIDACGTFGGNYFSSVSEHFGPSRTMFSFVQQYLTRKRFLVIVLQSKVHM